MSKPVVAGTPSITDGFQFDPEQTTAALVVSHPDAKYYALARSGSE